MNQPHPSEMLSRLQTALAASRKLKAIFSSVTLGNTLPPAKTWNARFLSLDNLVKDLPNDPAQAIAKDKIEVEYCPPSEYTNFHLVQKYGSRIPAEGVDDVSFFDDWRLQQAKEACGDCQEYLLIKGDLTGIQDFIYGDIPIENPGGISDLAKRLRGKSFFVAVITDFLAELVLERLDLSYCNLLFAGGGHFNLLAPWSDENEKALNRLSREINLRLRTDSNNRLALVLASVQCGKDIFTDATECMEEVNNKRDDLKYSQHRGYLESVFGSQLTAGGDEPAWEDIGSVVPKANHLLQLVSTQKLPSRYGMERLYDFSFEGSGKFITLYLVKGDLEEAVGDMLPFLEKGTGVITDAKLISLNNLGFLEPASHFASLQGKIPFHFGFRLVGNEAPKDAQRNLLDFEAIAKTKTGVPDDPSQKEQPLIYPQLAVVRLDVDDLGYLFGHGLKKNPDLRHFAALSRELNLFFCGHFNQVAKDFGMYVVYSGGDDAFAVGNWASTLHFVERLCEDFKTFTGKNQDLHFSAGIFTCDEHFPVARFADEAGDLEQAAKHFNRTEKNRIHVFNHILPAENFVKTLRFGKQILAYTAAEDKEKEMRLSKGLVNRVLFLIKRSFHDRTEKVEGDLRSRGQMNVERFYNGSRSLHYLFARNGWTNEKTQNATDELTREIIKYFIDNWRDETQSVLKDTTVALHYVLFRKRKPKNN